jgi:hypothetical protein
MPTSAQRRRPCRRTQHTVFPHTLRHAPTLPTFFPTQIDSGANTFLIDTHEYSAIPIGRQRVPTSALCIQHLENVEIESADVVRDVGANVGGGREPIESD